jgi:hypothetical protein
VPDLINPPKKTSRRKVVNISKPGLKLLIELLPFCI